MTVLLIWYFGVGAAVVLLLIVTDLWDYYRKGANHPLMGLHPIEFFATMLMSILFWPFLLYMVIQGGNIRK